MCMQEERSVSSTWRASSSEIILRALDPRSVLCRLLGMHAQARHTQTAGAYCRVGNTLLLAGLHCRRVSARGAGMRQQHKQLGRPEEENRCAAFSSRRL